MSNGLKLLWDGDENVLKLFDSDVHGAICISSEIPKCDLEVMKKDYYYFAGWKKLKILLQKIKFSRFYNQVNVT